LYTVGGLRGRTDVRPKFTEISYTVTDDGIATIRMQRPERLNGWGSVMSGEIVAAFDDARASDDVRVVILTGSEKAFCAGGDATTIVSGFVDHADAQHWAVEVALGHVRNVLPTLKKFDKLVVGAINGITAGACLAAALMCDVRIASESARFGNIYMRRGTVPSMAPYYLPPVVGLGQTCRLIFTDPVIGAHEAARVGMVSRVVADDDLDREALDLARRIAAKPAHLLRLTKRALRMAREADYDTCRSFVATAGLVARAT
jgi:2-(1,2-epoxy-1,2-dihydrophenyl)acetyl-CoA isomerase